MYPERLTEQGFARQERGDDSQHSGLEDEDATDRLSNADYEEVTPFLNSVSLSLSLSLSHTHTRNALRGLPLSSEKGTAYTTLTVRG